MEQMSRHVEQTSIIFIQNALAQDNVGTIHGLDLVKPSYIEARKFIESRGRSIFNAGVVGKLKIF
jgi:hypothetical protein